MEKLQKEGTNIPSSEADITLPLTGLDLADGLVQGKALLDQLAVFIEHSDGEKELVRGELVDFATTVPRLVHR